MKNSKEIYFKFLNNIQNLYNNDIKQHYLDNTTPEIVEKLNFEISNHEFQNYLDFLDNIDLYDLFIFKNEIIKVLKEKFNINFDNCKIEEIEFLLKSISEYHKSTNITTFKNYNIIIQIFLYWCIIRFGYNNIIKYINLK
jgi:hypothetical protein